MLKRLSKGLSKNLAIPTFASLMILGAAEVWGEEQVPSSPPSCATCFDKQVTIVTETITTRTGEKFIVKKGPDGCAETVKCLAPHSFNANGDNTCRINKVRIGEVLKLKLDPYKPDLDDVSFLETGRDKCTSVVIDHKSGHPACYTSGGRAWCH